MQDHDRNRLIRSLDDAIELIEREAFCYCYRDDPEYLELIEILRAHRLVLQKRNMGGGSDGGY